MVKVLVLLRKRLKKQSVSEKYSSVRVAFTENSKNKNFVVSRLVFFSFNYNVENLPDYFVMHIDNDWKNNTLENLKIGTTSEISNLTFKKGKMNHLKLGNPCLSKHKIYNAKIENNVITELECISCKKIKPITFFPKNCNSCKKCCSDKNHFKKLNKGRVKGFEIKETEVETGNVVIYNNFNDKDLLKKISVGTAIKYAKSGEICKPKINNKTSFKPFKLEVLYT